MLRSYWGAFIKGRFHNKSNSEPIRRGAFLQGPFLQGVGGGGTSKKNESHLRQTLSEIKKDWHKKIGFRNEVFFGVKEFFS